MARWHAVRDEVKALQTQDVIEPNRARVAHGRPQHAAKRFELSGLEAGRIESGQTPVLSRCVEGVWRRTNCHRRQDGVLIAPRVEAVAANPDRNIEVEPERQSPFAGFGATTVELIVGYPLYKLEQADRCRVGLMKRSEVFVLRSSPRSRPFPPRMSE